MWASMRGENGGMRIGGFLGWFVLKPLDDHDPAVVELGYRLNKAAWGRGYATEGSQALIDKGFTELGCSGSQRTP